MSDEERENLVEEEVDMRQSRGCEGGGAQVGDEGVGRGRGQKWLY